MKNRRRMNSQDTGAKADKYPAITLMYVVDTINFLLPSVSPMNPHKCELRTTPMKLMPEIIPFSERVRLKSHWAVGKI